MRFAARSFRSILVFLLVCSLLFLSPVGAALALLQPPAPSSTAPTSASGVSPTATGVTVYTPDTVQLAGATRLETAIAVSKSGWDHADAVVLATASKFPDALVGAPLAALLDAPILLTDSSHLPAGVAAEIARLGATSAVLLGAEPAIGDAVIADLTQLGIARQQIVRIGGTDRYDTARLVAHRVCDATGLGDRVAVAVGTNYPDALAVSVLASRIGMPIVLTRGDQLSPAAAEVLSAFDTTETLIAGGEAAVSRAVADRLPNPVRIGGADRFETAALLAEYATRFGLGFENIFVATGMNFPDALAVGPLAAKTGGTLVLAARDTLPVASAELLARHCSAIQLIHYVGGLPAVGAGVRTAIGTASETRVSDVVEVADTATESALETIAPDGTMVFDAATTQVMDLQPGAILAGGGTDDGAPGSSGAPDGYLRKVVSAPQTTGPLGTAAVEVSVETTEASLEEAFEQASIDFSEPIEEIPVIQGLAVVDGAIVSSGKVAPLAGFEIGFDISESYEFQLAKGNDNLETGVKATGLLHVAGGAYINVSIRSWKLQTFAAGVYGGEDLDLEVNAWLSAKIEKERELFSKRVARTRFSVGPIPVMIDFVLSGKVVFEASGEVGFLAGVEQSASFRYGYEYQRGTPGDNGDGWRQIRERNFSWGRTGPEIWANCEATAYGRIQLDVKFYGIGGPYVGFNAGLEFEASTPVFSPEFPPEPPGSTSGYTCDLNAFVDLVPGVAVKVKIWKFTVLSVSKEWPIRLVTWDLYEYNAPPVPPGDAPKLDALIPVDKSTLDVYFETVPGHDLVVTPARYHITAGEDPGGAPLAILGVTCLGEGHVRIQTAEQTEACYWVECEEGAVTDLADRTNELIHQPFMPATVLDLSNVIAESVGWGPPTPDISGVEGQSRFIVWRDYPDMHMDIGWYDLLQNTTGTTVCDGWPYDLGVSGDTAVWYYEDPYEVTASEVWTQSLPLGTASLYSQNMRTPLLADDWLMYQYGVDPTALCADGLVSGHTVTLSNDTTEFKEWTLGDGKACLLYPDGSIELRDLATGLHEPLTSEPRNLSNIRIDDGRVVCLEDSERILVFDLSEETPVARELLDPTASWDRFEIYGTSIVAYDSASGLWAGDLLKDPVRWRRLVLPDGYMFDDYDVYGPDIAASIALPTEQMNIYLITP